MLKSLIRKSLKSLDGLAAALLPAGLSGGVLAVCSVLLVSGLSSSVALSPELGSSDFLPSALVGDFPPSNEEGFSLKADFGLGGAMTFCTSRVSSLTKVNPEINNDKRANK